jgi:hypothetical protein
MLLTQSWHRLQNIPGEDLSVGQVGLVQVHPPVVVVALGPLVSLGPLSDCLVPPVLSVGFELISEILSLGI